jgi:hypothetical protein
MQQGVAVILNPDTRWGVPLTLNLELNPDLRFNL